MTLTEKTYTKPTIAASASKQAPLTLVMDDDLSCDSFPFWFGQEEANHVKRILREYSKALNLNGKRPANSRAPLRFVGRVARRPEKVNVKQAVFETVDIVSVFELAAVCEGFTMPLVKQHRTYTLWNVADGLPREIRLLKVKMSPHALSLRAQHVVSQGDGSGISSGNGNGFSRGNGSGFSLGASRGTVSHGTSISPPPSPRTSHGMSPHERLPKLLPHERSPNLLLHGRSPKLLLHGECPIPVPGREEEEEEQRLEDNEYILALRSRLREHHLCCLTPTRLCKGAPLQVATAPIVPPTVPPSPQVAPAVAETIQTVPPETMPLYTSIGHSVEPIRTLQLHNFKRLRFFQFQTPNSPTHHFRLPPTQLIHHSSSLLDIQAQHEAEEEIRIAEIMGKASIMNTAEAMNIMKATGTVNGMGTPETMNGMETTGTMNGMEPGSSGEEDFVAVTQSQLVSPISFFKRRSQHPYYLYCLPEFGCTETLVQRPHFRYMTSNQRIRVGYAGEQAQAQMRFYLDHSKRVLDAHAVGALHKHKHRGQQQQEQQQPIHQQQEQQIPIHQQQQPCISLPCNKDDQGEFLSQEERILMQMMAQDENDAIDLLTFDGVSDSPLSPNSCDGFVEEVRTNQENKEGDGNDDDEDDEEEGDDEEYDENEDSDNEDGDEEDEIDEDEIDENDEEDSDSDDQRDSQCYLNSPRRRLKQQPHHHTCIDTFTERVFTVNPFEDLLHGVHAAAEKMMCRGASLGISATSSSRNGHISSRVDACCFKVNHQDDNPFESDDNPFESDDNPFESDDNCDDADEQEEQDLSQDNQTGETGKDGQTSQENQTGTETDQDNQTGKDNHICDNDWKYQENFVSQDNHEENKVDVELVNCNVNATKPLSLPYRKHHDNEQHKQHEQHEQVKQHDQVKQHEQHDQQVKRFRDTNFEESYKPVSPESRKTRNKDFCKQQSSNLGPSFAREGNPKTNCTTPPGLTCK